MPTYQFRRGGDASLVAGELERIRLRDGALRSEAIVTEAEPEDSPLHSYFEWDDAAAAHQQRLVQARHLVRTIVVVTDDREPVSMYVHVRQESANEGEYTPLSVVAQAPDLYLSALAEARRDLAAAQRRVGELLDVARARSADPGEVARIMLAVQALQTATDAIAPLH